MTKKKALGRGLGNFLSNKSEIDEIIYPEKNIFMEINLELIMTNENQPRKYFDQESLKELSESIKNYGIIEPLILKKDGDKFLVISGERRFRAAKLAGLERVPAIIKDIESEESDKIALIENIQREDLNAIEEARSYKYLIEEYNLRQEDLAKEVGKSRQYIGNTIRLLNLDERVIDLIFKGDLSPSHGKALLSIKDKEKQFREAKKIVKNSISVAKTEKLSSKKDQGIDIFTENIKDELTSFLGTKVVFKGRGKVKKLEIEYYNEDDLQRICDLILGRI
ncbi:ParB/RepB/Spo0J family partition protein [Peptoniphilus raoultii]|uniref:ParB/RepB/Spo0J family partition protein n=1 Tax=Peptoniphilus raoultii TaxID=1776387 RepID=UPI0008D91D33|nr:ParB/RepB/Spo0J family partition protein [Peptoniphilus raoultii]